MPYSIYLYIMPYSIHMYIVGIITNIAEWWPKRILERLITEPYNNIVAISLMTLLWVIMFHQAQAVDIQSETPSYEAQSLRAQNANFNVRRLPRLLSVSPSCVSFWAPPFGSSSYI